MSLTSTVVANRENQEYEWYEESYLIPHEAIRFYLFNFQKAVRANKGEPASNALLAGFYTKVNQFLLI